MHSIDIIIIAIYFIISFSIALYLSGRSGRSTEDFFLSGRKLPWWIAGTTMVATTFAADTPLSVTELVAKNGISGNWLWWNFVAGNILTVFFFAKLWRRANVLTDVEFVEIRYSGKEAAFLRGFKSLYLGIFMNIIIMGWVNIALKDILTAMFGIEESYVIFILFGAMILVGVYSALSGLWGIAFTDMFQFIIAMGGCIFLAYHVLSLPQVGGIAGLKKALPESAFSFIPSIKSILSNGSVEKAGASKSMTLSLWSFLALLLMPWWASWYPGSEPGGGGYVAQRMMSAKNESHSLKATLWFTIAHYALRPWPWILVALASLVLFPGLSNPRMGFVLTMKQYLPVGFLGLLIAAFLAAYMSTISTQLNWGTSYVVNDFYKRFIQTGKSEKHYIIISRIITLILVLFSCGITLIMNSISGAWEFIINCGAGLGLVLILRWYWWRINAWSEIVAMIAPFIAYSINVFFIKLPTPVSLFFIVPFTTVSWLIATFVTKPVDKNVLIAFVNRVNPGGKGWSVLQNEVDVPASKDSLGSLFINWILGTILVYSSLFAIGNFIFQDYTPAIILTAIVVIISFIFHKRLKEV